jgi:hypothetical protein
VSRVAAFRAFSEAMLKTFSLSALFFLAIGLFVAAYASVPLS